MNRETQGHSYKKMKFDGEESDYSDLESLPSESESEIPSDDGIIGNDSFDFNERAKFGGTYMKRKNWNEDEISAFPKTEGNEFQTTDVKSQIFKIETMLVSFTEKAGQELQVLKQLIEAPSTSGIGNETLMFTKVMETLEKNCNKVSNEEIVTDKENSGSSNVEHSVANRNAYDQTTTSNTEANACNVEMVDLDVPIVSAGGAEHLKDSSNAIISDVEKDSDEMAVSSIIDYLPIKTIPQYKEVDGILEVENIEAKVDAEMIRQNSMIEHLLPLENEPEAKYMNRSIELLFDSKFFVDTIMWKKEEDRIKITHSHILVCWKKSFETKYGLDEKNSKFMAHFRRYKSAKRAADKAQLKRSNAENNTK